MSTWIQRLKKTIRFVHYSKLLYWSGQLLMFEQGIRFLTDFLLNDVYYRTERPLHNLDRARNQMHLLRAYTERREALEGRAQAALAAVRR